ncbi:hypothetical protein I302_100121 [Kwoniella bestiolae CBS 10118]|uniref:BTB domain-containing protein n=1 Tax=Kwoniella bestiolae CBS 10118 TaxID=1296100 RepID=A0AAJ8JZH3_9TREE
MSNATKDSPLRSMTYNSDEADVTLLSSDGTEFKVHSYMLKAHSLVLRPILCDPAFKPSPMTIDASPEDLTCFLDLMHNKPPHTISDWPQAEKVLDLIDQYECDVASERIWVVLNEKAKSEPWRVFCLASKRNSLALAKHALSCMAPVLPSGTHSETFDITIHRII